MSKKTFLLVSIGLVVFAVAFGLIFERPVTMAAAPQGTYTPMAVFCANNNGALCPIMPGYIGPDPAIKTGVGYNGIFAPLPTSAAKDAQSPFDNMSWQSFVALNWSASQLTAPPTQGLSGLSRTVWQDFYFPVSSLFGNSPGLPDCTNPENLPTFYVGSDGSGNPAALNGEYFQASTDLPLVDINGNWTLYERKTNLTEVLYMVAPGGKPENTLLTVNGQNNFIKAQQTVSFPATATTPTGAPGAVEIKVSWRILNQGAGDNPSRYFNQRVRLGVAPDLVANNPSRQSICATVTLGLVGFHIIQKNVANPANGALKNQWFWATFEHVDNAPMAKAPCSVTSPQGCQTPNWQNQPSCGAASPTLGTRYSYFDPKGQQSSTNVQPAGTGINAPKFPWNSTQPYAMGGVTPATMKPQVTRCWSIYPLTASLNTQWQTKLKAINSPFQYYQLVGTQWGSGLEIPPPPMPLNAVPSMLSNTTLETYIQMNTKDGPGSCVSCHEFAKLAVAPRPASDFSFLPGLAQGSTLAIRGVKQTPMR
jgi:hypothetical protein